MAYLKRPNHLGAAARDNLHWLGGILWREKKTKEEEEERAKETEEKRIRSIVRKMAPLQATSERKSQEMEGERQRTRGTKLKRKLRNRFRYFSSEIPPSQDLLHGRHLYRRRCEFYSFLSGERLNEAIFNSCWFRSGNVVRSWGFRD